MRWIFEDGGFTPTGKIVGNQSFSIVSDHLGPPIAMYDSRGSAVWNQTLSIWGERESRGAVGDPTLCPFRYPGQYEDDETGLYYNRFRYFDPSIGEYVSVDPIGLAGGNPTLFGYVGNPMGEYDPFGLMNALQAMAHDAHSALPEKSQRYGVTAIGEDSNGKRYMSSSSKYVPKKQKEWAKANEVEVIQSKRVNVHAEQSLWVADKGIVKIEPNKPICIDCENGMRERNIHFETATTGKKSKNRRPGQKHCGGGK